MQVHIDTGEAVSRTPGPVKLSLPDLKTVEHQLQQLAPRLRNTQFKADVSPDYQHASVIDPWGQQFSVSQKPSTHVREGSTVGSFEGLLLPCHIGTASAIAQFYTTMLQVIAHRIAAFACNCSLHCETHDTLEIVKLCCLPHVVALGMMSEESSLWHEKSTEANGLQAETTEHTTADGQVYVQVQLGHGTTFTFQEDAKLGSLQTQEAIKAYEGWHCALYVADFEATYNRIVQAGINQVDHPYKDKADTLEGAKHWNQFRFCDIVAVQDSSKDSAVVYKKGQLLYRFGHEIRSLEHCRCPKVLLVEQ